MKYSFLSISVKNFLCFKRFKTQENYVELFFQNLQLYEKYNALKNNKLNCSLLCFSLVLSCKFIKDHNISGGMEAR